MLESVVNFRHRKELGGGRDAVPRGKFQHGGRGGGAAERRAGERALATAKAKLPGAVAGTARSVPRAVQRSDKEIRKELKANERTIAQLDARRKEVTAAFMATNDADAAVRFEAEINSIGEQLAVAEDKWVQLNEELGEAE